MLVSVTKRNVRPPPQRAGGVFLAMHCRNTRFFGDWNHAERRSGGLSGRPVGMRRRGFHGADYVLRTVPFLQSFHRITQVFHALRVDG